MKKLNEVEPAILTPKEKAYLENVLKPFKDEVNYVKKEHFGLYESIRIEFENDEIRFPYFITGEHYRGMWSNKKYTLEQLGLFKEEEE